MTSQERTRLLRVVCPAMPDAPKRPYLRGRLARELKGEFLVRQWMWSGRMGGFWSEAVGSGFVVTGWAVIIHTSIHACE
jgi:hypothetical protein